MMLLLAMPPMNGAFNVALMPLPATLLITPRHTPDIF